MKTWRWVTAALLLAAGGAAEAGDLVITSFDRTGRLAYGALSDGTNYNYRVEWAPSPAGPWSSFGGTGAFWLDAKPQAAGAAVTNTVPMCYRVVATRGDYMVIDVSGGTGATSYPVSYYRTLADVPGGANSDAYKMTNILMRLMPKGSFTMGSPLGELGRYDDDEGQHQVTLISDFYMGVFEVTQRQWELVMGNKPSYFTNATYYQTRPVEQVSYFDIRENSANSDDPAVEWPSNSAVNANSFMGKLRAKTGLTGFDLPTESQWEYACRAGTATALNSGYNRTSFTNDSHMSEVGRYNIYAGYSQDCAPSSGTAIAGSYLANQWGLYDTLGNVFEWCLDWYEAYPGTVTDPPGGTSGVARVFRGGGWYYYYARNCRSADRYWNYPSYREASIGFRICFVPPDHP